MKESLLSLTFLYFINTLLQAQINQILINEIYADPSPSNGLPAAEFVEIYNSNATEIYQLSEVLFRNSTKTFSLPNIMLEPNGYIILCHIDDVTVLSNYGTIVGIKSFPALVNTRDELALETKEGEIIHTVDYRDTWYGNADKEDGGWSLELIDPFQPCLTEENWIASLSIIGGTPGKKNSVYQPGLIHPTFEVNTLAPIDEHEIQLFFSQRVSSNALPSDFQLEGSHAEIIQTFFENGNHNILRLTIEPPLDKGIQYGLTINLHSCQNNPLDQDHLEFRLPEDVEPGDLLINEILFNPSPGGTDFLEIFNASNKELNIHGLFIGNIGPDGFNDAEAIIAEHLIKPNQYLVFASDPDLVLDQYYVEDPSALLENKLPGFPDDEGNVTLYRIDASNGTELIIDAFDYHEEFHSKLLKEVEGVSLERILPNKPTELPSNWHSASQPSGYGTPTAVNSQNLEPFASNASIQITPQTFSPDGDGRDDFLFINYAFEQSGFLGNVKIFDAAGRLIKYLWNNVPLSTSGFLKWDGDTDENEKAPLGIYIVWIQAFHPNGQVQKWKGTCVLAGNLD
jgi:hypothetical protein